MEQGKGADSLLASRAKTASAGVIPALAALLALAGCGGSPESESSDAGRSAGQGAATTSPAPSAKGAAEQEQATAREGERAEASTKSGKRGSSVSIPRGAPEPGITPGQRATAAVADIALASPAVPEGAGGAGRLPSAYTCDGKDSWPELRWANIPPGTAELVLFAMSLAPVEGKLFFDWAVAGIDPETEGIEAARLPRGAVTGQNGYGRNDYSVCPTPGQSETYFFALYALPERLPAQAGFDPRALREQVQELSRNVGLLPVSYARVG